MENSKRKISFNFGAKGWVVTIFAMLVFLFVYLWENGLNYFIPAYAAEYGWSTSYLYGCQTIGYVIGCAAMIVMGRIIRKNGSKGVMIVTMALSIIAMFIISKATTLAMYSVGAILFPACSCIFCWQCVGDLGVNWFPKKRGLYMGFATLGIVFSMFIVNGVIFPYMQKAGAESAIFRLAVLGLCLLVFLVLFIKSNPEQAGAYPDNDRSISYEEVKKRNAVGEAHRLSSEWNSYGKCLKSPAVWIITLSTGLILLIQRGCMASMVPALMSFGHEQSVAANLMMISGALALVCSLVGGMVDEKLGTRHAMTICGIAGTAACILFAFFSSSAVAAEIALILLGYAGSAGNNYQPSFTAEIFGRYDFDVPYSLIICMSTALSSLGYVAISAIGTSSGFQTAYLVCCVLSIISIIMTVTYKGRYEGRKELDQAEIDKLYEEIMRKQA